MMLRLETMRLATASLAILVLLASLFAHRRALSDQQARLEHYRRIAVRTAAAERLIGTSLPRTPLLDRQGVQAEIPIGIRTLVWIVDIDRCVACLDDVGAWNALVADPVVAPILVMSGATAAQASRIVKGARMRGTVLVDPGGTFRRAVTGDPTSTFMLIDRSGVIRMADVRGSDGSCANGFVSQVVAFLRDHENARIARAPASRGESSFP